MKINKPAVSGSLESNDILIQVFPDVGVNIELNSVVYQQFAHLIYAVIKETLQEYHVDNIKIIAEDKGALDYTIKARLINAIERSQ